MKYNLLGKSNLRVSEIGFGCMSLLKTAQPEAAAIVQKAIDTGINYFDTADLYDKGANELAIGKLLKPIRNHIILATKVGNRWKADGSGWDWNPTKKHILSAVDASLQRLQTDYIDLYQLHGGTINDNTEEIIETFEQLIQQGKIRHYGISSIRPNVIKNYVEQSNIASVMLQYSILDRRPEENVLNLLLSHRVGAVVRGALAQGFLINKIPKDYLGHNAAKVQCASNMLKEIATTFQTTPAALAIRYASVHPAISSVVVGISSMQYLKDITDIVNAQNNKWIKELQEAIPANNYAEHR